MRLVLADNDRDALDLIELDLRLEGHDIVGLASDGAGAIEACREARPDVLVVDYRMPPGANGLDVAQRVLKDGTAVRVVVYSNYVDRRLLDRAVRLGVTYVAKGDLDALRAAVLG